ncbi:MAG TPA: PIN domain-containing protein [Phycisphaerae bacterium]|nr:PIN domain-containing protein [Phycisphaerae bacterium]
MNAIFADTSFFIALIEKSDQYHHAAVAFSRQNRRPLITSSAVALELGAYFSKGPRRPLFSLCLQAIERAHVEQVHVTHQLQERAIALFNDRPDKEYSLVDCISFVLMTEAGIRDAATTDGHFEQEHFSALLRNLQPRS